jgi:hypothetical protein
MATDRTSFQPTQSTVATSPKGVYSRSPVVELLVVVLGILIAFAVDAAWEGRSERLSERETINALEADFRSSVDLLEARWLVIHRKAVDATDALMWALQVGAEWPGSPMDMSFDEYIDQFVVPVSRRNVEPRTWTVEVPDSLLGQTLITPTYDPTLASLEALRASGRLNVIRSRALRDALAEFPSLLADASDEERMSRDHVLNQLRPQLARATSMVRAELIRSHWVEFEHDALPPEVLENLRPITASVELVNVLATRSNIASDALYELIGVRDAMLRILELIEAERR